MNVKNECLLCGENSAVLKQKAYPGYQEPMSFEIIHCENCNTAYSLPRIDDSKSIYDNIYKNVSKIPGYNRYRKYQLSVKRYKNPLKYLARTEATYWGVNEALQRIIKIKESVKILEVGSGLGYLTYALNKNGYNVLGLDISETAVYQANSYFGNYFVCGDLFNYVEANSNSFDIVILTEVIEHVNEPFSFITSLFKLIKPGGSVILTTPNKSFYPSDIIWDSESPPVHSWWFSESSIVYISNKLNAKTDFINFSKFYQDRYAICNLEYLRNHQMRAPILDKNGHVKVRNIKYIQLLNIVFQRLMSYIPFCIRLFKYTLNKLTTNTLLYGRRGNVLCAILQKK